MKPLLYLSIHTVINGIRRALKSPGRLVGIIILVVYWGMILMRQPSSRTNPFMPPGAPSIHLPPEQVIFAVIFALFLGILMFRALMMFSPPGNYRAADADVLFPTPVPPAYIMIHRFIVDYFFTLFFPLLIYLLVRRNGMRGIEPFFKDLPPGSVQQIGKSLFVAFFLVSLFAVAFTYAVGICINRATKQSQVGRVAAEAAYFGAIAWLGIEIARAVFSDQPGAHLVALANSAIMKIVAFPAAAAANLALSPLHPGSAQAFLSAAILIVGSVLLFVFAASQAPHLYDMAARRSIPASQRREAMRAGQTNLIWTRAAIEGKLSKRSLKIIQKARLQGSAALVWRDLVLQYRLFLWAVIPIALLLTAAAALPLLDDLQRKTVWATFASLVVLMLPMMTPALTQSGFQETLQRSDLIKPLPFPLLSICLMDSLAKSVVPTVCGWCAACIMLALMPSQWPFAVAIFVGFPSVAFFSASISWITIILFPDLNDPAQRTMRGLAMMLGFLAIYLPGVLIVGGGLWLKFPILILMLPAALLYACLGYIACTISVPLFIRYNPAE